MSIIERLHEQLDADALEYLKLARSKGHALQIIQSVQADGTVLAPRFSIDGRTEKRRPAASGRAN